jgi:glycosyltransferase involved in cell wall biosynthesis
MPKPNEQVISVILPAHNESASLPVVVSAVTAELKRLDVTPEIIVVDDGSTDATRAVMMSLAATHQHLRYIRFSRNFGKEAAISAGLASARGAAVVIMDADGQHPASMLPKFVELWRAGSEIVFASHVKRADPPWLRMVKRSYYGMMRAGSSVDIPPNAGDFRLLDRKVIDVINALPERNRFMKGLYGWVGFKSQNVPYEVAPRIAGRTRYSLRRLISLGLTGLTSFSVVPLRLVSVAGVVVSAAAVIYGCFLIIEHVVGSAQIPPGWSTLAVGMMFLSGLQLLCLGVIGEYLGRIFQEVKARPLYVVAEDSSAASPADRSSEPPREAKVIKL